MRPRSQNSIPNVIFALLVINGIVFALQQLEPRFLMINFALWPAGPTNTPFMPWQLLTYGFLHGNLMHIFFNMFGLWMFGRELELLMGSKRFLTYFLTCVIGAGIVQLVVAEVQGGLYPTVGASGGVFGILLAYALAFPNRMVMLIFPPIPMRAKYFRSVLRIAGTVSRFQWQCAGGRQLRAPRWYAFWLHPAAVLEPAEASRLTPI